MSASRNAANREANEDGGGTMAMENDNERFAKIDQQVSALKERIARQHEAIKQAKLRGHATPPVEAAQEALVGTLRAFEKRRQQVFQRMEATRARPDKPDVP